MKPIHRLATILLAFPSAAWSCSPYQEEPFQREAIPASGELIPTVAPTARVVGIRRGSANRGDGSCGDLASIIVAVRDDSPGRPFVFSFEQVAGAAPDTIFGPGLYAGASNGADEQVFYFHWPDLQAQPAPFEVTVKVTPHSRSGTPGPSSTLLIRDGLR